VFHKHEKPEGSFPNATHLMNRDSLKFLIGGAIVGVGVYAALEQLRKRKSKSTSSSTSSSQQNNVSESTSSSTSSTPPSTATTNLSGSRRRMASQEDMPEREKRKHPNKPVIVWVDGVFDMMHFGHANMLRQAKALGDKLIVGVNSDESVLKEKGFLPVMNEAERIIAVQGCKWADEVVPCKNQERDQNLFCFFFFFFDFWSSF
jgi:cytidyltransferase-like protein